MKAFIFLCVVVVFSGCKARQTAPSSLKSVYQKDLESEARRRKASADEAAWVLRTGIGPAGGTTFLISDDLLMTNQHLHLGVGQQLVSGLDAVAGNPFKTRAKIAEKSKRMLNSIMPSFELLRWTALNLELQITG